jgi:non-ribosomal peptide synthase protein (TIGR01720 family)
MDDLAERLANLSPEKRAIILRQIVQREGYEGANQDEQGLVTGSVPLLPAQRQLLTMLAAYRLNYHHYNMCTMLEVMQPLNPELAKQAVQHLLLYHDALRLRLTRDESGWQQWIVKPDADIPFSTRDFSLLPEEKQKAAIEAAAAELQTSLNVTTGPVLRVAYFYLGDQQPGRLLFVVHHIASDAYSLQLLFKDFMTVYQQLAEGKAIQLPPKTTSVKRRAERILEYARSTELRNELDYWFALPWAEVVPLPPDFPEGVTAPLRPQTFKVIFPREETQALIRSVSRFGGSQIRDVILTALLRVFADWNGSRTQLLAIHNHGRKQIFDEVDLLRTVGWLTVHPNVVLQLPATDVPEEMVRSITEQMERIPGDGMGYELLRNASGDAELTAKFHALPGPDIVFNYLGQKHPSSLVRSARESVGPQSCLPNLWKSDIQMIFAEIVDSQIRLHWEYSETVYQRSTIERLANQFVETLQSMIQHY